MKVVWFLVKRIWELEAELEPANLQWSGQKIGLDYNLLMCHGIISLPILYMESGDKRIILYI